MTLEYQLDEKDYLLHQLFLASRSDRIKKKRYKSKIRYPLIYLVFAALLFFFTDKAPSAIIFVVIAVLWYFLYPVWEKRHYVKHYQSFIRENYKNRFGRTAVLTLDKDYITTSDESGEGRIYTREVDAINEIPAAIFIHLKTGESLMLPKDKFQDLEDLKDRLSELAIAWNVNYSKDNNWMWK